MLATGWRVCGSSGWYGAGPCSGLSVDTWTPRVRCAHECWHWRCGSCLRGPDGAPDALKPSQMAGVLGCARVGDLRALLEAHAARPSAAATTGRPATARGCAGRAAQFRRSPSAAPGAPAPPLPRWSSACRPWVRVPGCCGARDVGDQIEGRVAAEDVAAQPRRVENAGAVRLVRHRHACAACKPARHAAARTKAGLQRRSLVEEVVHLVGREVVRARVRVDEHRINWGA